MKITCLSDSLYGKHARTLRCKVKAGNPYYERHRLHDSLPSGKELAEIKFCQNCKKSECKHGYCDDLKKFSKNYSKNT